MLFNSHGFIFLFLPIVLCGYFFFIQRRLPRYALSFLLASSLFFYAYWDYRFLVLLIGSIGFNFGMGYLISKWDDWKKKGVFFLAIGLDLALLFHFKYFTFIKEVFASLTGQTHTFEGMILPLGISFFTFTQIAYLIDLYQGKAKSSDFISYALFVTVFPHLIAGPILHHKDMMTQFDDMGNKGWSIENISKGIFLFIVGLTKKVLIADYLSTLVSPVFDGPLESLPFFHAWCAALIYTLQLYFDFSGYSDMAVGLGLLFNLHLPINFDSPYKATSMIDFWRRWHISLSIFLRDYLYIPLGGNRNGDWAKMQNLFVTMLLGGIWHGAGWTFVLWGACHGFLLIINHTWRSFRIHLPNSFSRIITFAAIMITWVIFRSPNITVMIHILKGMFGMNGVALPTSFGPYLSWLSSFGVEFIHLEHLLFKGKEMILLVIMTIVVLFLPNSNYWKERFFHYRFSGALCACIFVFVLLNLTEVSEFLYYQF
ncbi:MAG: MBOAT family O-acyltransferase [Parachlamydiaceae bacterium]|nr:MBOAT family O-acyltransferase [Parachlamydiaceae bacterium]